MKDLKIRASALGRIMTNDKDTTITEKQLATLNGLLTKIKLTDKQAQLRDALELKRDAKQELSTGGKTYIRELALYDKFGIRQEINNKYLDKGNLQEDLSIELAETMLEVGRCFKNDEYFSNDYVHGTPDVVTDEVIIDVKTSWSASSFPFFDEVLKNRIYEWQLKAYIWLTGKTTSYLCYCLVPTPEVLILDEMRRVSWKRGEAGEVSEAVEKEVREFHSVEHIPVWSRVKSFKVELTGEDIKQMKEKVELAREYYNEIINTI